MGFIFSGTPCICKPKNKGKCVLNLLLLQKIVCHVSVSFVLLGCKIFVCIYFHVVVFFLHVFHESC